MPLFGVPDVPKLKSKGDVGGLVQALRFRKDARVRRDAARALGEIKDPKGMEALIGALGDHDADVCWAAAEALGEFGDVRAVDPLIAAHGKLHVPPWVAVESLGKITTRLTNLAPATRAVKALIAALEQPPELIGVRDAHEYERQSAMAAVVQVGSRGPSDPVGGLVLELLRDDLYASTETNRREMAESALVQIGPAALPVVVADLRSPDRAADAAKLIDILGVPEDADTQAYYAVAKRDWDRAAGLGAPAVPPLVAMLDSSDPNDRQAAAWALISVGLPAFDSLASALNRHAHKDEIASLLGRIGAESSDPVFRGRVAKFLAPFLYVALTKDTAAQGLARLAEQGVKPLVAALNSGKGPAVLVAASALQTMAIETGDPALVTQILESLIAALHYGDWATRMTAAKGLETLYKHGKLEPRDKQRILDMRRKMAEQHEDYVSGPVNDELMHVDTGIGWSFGQEDA